MRWLPFALLAGCAAPVARHSEAVSGTHSLWIDLTGASVTAAQADDALTDESSLGGANVPAFDASTGAPKVAAALAAQVLVDRARTLYLPFDVQISTTRPSSGEYAAVYVGGTAAISATQPDGVAGVGAVDCDDANPASVGFAFSQSATPAQGGLVALAATIAHEAGHGFGLEHTTNPHDPMYSVAMPLDTVGDLFSLAFGSGNYSSFVAGGGAAQPERCGHADPLDNVALLGSALGVSTAALDVAPELALEFPPDRPTLPPTLPIAVSATGATRVEVYANLELVAVLADAPYETTLELATAGATTLTIEAVSADAQRSRVSRTFAVDDTVPPACTATRSCTAPATCVDGFCAVGSADLSISGDAATTDAKRSGGCAVGPVDASALSPLLVAALLTARRRRRVIAKRPA